MGTTTNRKDIEKMIETHYSNLKKYKPHTKNYIQEREVFQYLEESYKRLYGDYYILKGSYNPESKNLRNI